ncbi:acyl carrier protein [Streptomyces sp. NPDC059452]|uniref:acyl carrier protein n=1 Tax=Streptomyces sp. NPDC059452 TaxID=3346835 RepID=UPI0036B0D8D6
MKDSEAFEAVKSFIEEAILKGQGEVESDTPLLEWGILDSLSVARLGNFIEKRFGVVLPGSSAIGERFHSLDTVCEFVAELRAAQAGAEPSAPRVAS